MRPLDPRLLTQVRGVRSRLAVTISSCLATTLLLLVQAWLLSSLITTDVRVSGLLVALAVVLFGRAALAGLAEQSALRAATRAKEVLRLSIVDRWLRADSRTSRTESAATSTLLTKGLDALDPYFARFLPQVVLGVSVPTAVVVVVAVRDWVSAVIIGITLPLIPIFMVLVGKHTQERTIQQWRAMARMAEHFADVVEGLPTLRIFQRSRAQARVIRMMSEEHRLATMSTLRVAFLSAFVLELLATLSTALVAVEVGLRLLHGSLSFQTALFVLVVAPEAYAPLRAVGAQFHASVEGAQAATAALDLVEQAEHRDATTGEAAMPSLAQASLEIRDVSVVLDGLLALDRASLTIVPGEHLAIVGASGSGKSTLLKVLLRLEAPTSGSLSAGGVDAGRISVERWRRELAWVPQQPTLFSGSVRDNLLVAAPHADDTTLWQALEIAHASGFVSRLPQGLSTEVGERAARLSSGQRQRLAIARAIVMDAPVLLVDEPTAHLDPLTADQLLRSLELWRSGRSLIVVTHDVRCSSRADRVVSLSHGHVIAAAPTLLAAS